MLQELIPLIVVMLVTGMLSGLLAGLLGIGGGLIIVPVLETALAFYNVDAAIRMHIAVATSLACIIVTSISSSRVHHANGIVQWDIIKIWGPAIIVGAILGTVGASYVEGQFLSGLFGIVTLMVALKMLLPLDNFTLIKGIPRGKITIVPPLFIGGISSMMGIGGATLSVPMLTLMNQSIHRAVGTSALFGFLISLPGALGFIVTGFNDPRLPIGSLGYVNFIGFALISPVSILMAPIGAKLAHKLSKRHLAMFFGCFIFIVSVRMLLRAFTTIGV